LQGIKLKGNDFELWLWFDMIDDLVIQERWTKNIVYTSKWLQIL